MNILKGYLTYIMAAVAILFGLWNAIFQTYTTTEGGLTMVWAGLATFGIRRALL